MLGSPFMEPACMPHHLLVPTTMAELRKRIEELSVAIERHKEILKDLEVRRNDARRELNAICDPMARLPTEISSAIFMCCLPKHGHPPPNSDTAPMIFLSVCRLWSDIALATPSLWAVIHFDFRSSYDLKPDADSHEHFELWLNRTGNHPLSLSLNGDLRDSVTAMKAHVHQVQTLQLDVGSLYPFVSEGISFSSLETLRVSAVDSTVYLSDCVKILRSAPLLVDCEFALLDPSDRPKFTQLLHTSLRHLRLGSSADILRYLTLPALESLRISELNISKISGDYRNLDDDTYFRYIPCVTDLALGSSNYAVSLFDGIAVQNFPRGLRHLTIRYWFPTEYSKLICLLTNRQLASLQIIFPWEDPANTPDDNVIAALRRLKENGMDIHVGPKDMNYI
ncbi:hypothetical protein K438DRAFT_771494 [Mycena galopus ATCC 62051]|nr:hypothetical protein K438DRAFT_771494 [Mycena galopus ATCC 62051]